MKWSVPKDLERWKEWLKKYQTVFLVLAAGLVLLALPTGTAGEREADSENSAVQESFDLEEFEEKLARILSQVEGAGETEVVLTLKSGSRQVLAQDVEQDGSRTSRTTVTVGGGSEKQVVALQTVSPQFQGAVVVCPGGDDPQVRLRLSQAVSALTGLGSDRISICKRT